MDILNHGMHVDDVSQGHPKYYVDIYAYEHCKHGTKSPSTNVLMNIYKSTLDVEIETKKFNT